MSQPGPPASAPESVCVKKYELKSIFDFSEHIHITFFHTNLEMMSCQHQLKAEDCQLMMNRRHQIL